VGAEAPTLKEFGTSVVPLYGRHLIGSWQQVLDGLAAYAEAGVSDLRIEVAAHTEAAREATRMALAEYLSS